MIKTYNMNLYKNIKNRELPVLLRAIYESNGGDMEQTAHDLESIDLMLGTMKMRSLINKHSGRKRHDYRKVIEAIVTRGGNQ